MVLGSNKADFSSELLDEKMINSNEMSSNKDQQNINQRQKIAKQYIMEDEIGVCDFKSTDTCQTESLKLDTISEESKHERTETSSNRLQNLAKPFLNKRNNRLIAQGGVAGKDYNSEAIIGYADEPLLPLNEACAPLVDLVHNIFGYIDMALSETPETPFGGLTVDESAAIRLYTMEWEKPYRSLYSMLNYTLKTAPREELKPYSKYLKLFLSALAKLPCVAPTTVWRGVAKDLSSDFPPGVRITWWAFSSCTKELTVLENEMYLGNQGERTLFSIEAINGRIIREHSHFATEDEILLLPGTYMEVQSQFSPAPGLRIIHLKQIKPTETLLQPPFEGACLYPPEPKRKVWYKNKRILFELSVFITLAIVGIIIGAVYGSKRSPPPPTCIPRRIGIQADYLWTFSCGDAREDLTGLYNGTTVNGANFVSPDYSGQDKALQLNRYLKQYVSLPRSLNLTLNTSFTLTCWILVSAYLPKTILSDCNYLNSICIIFLINDTHLIVRIFNWTNGLVIQEVSGFANGSICQGCWMHIAFTFDHLNESMIMYFSGDPIKQTYLKLEYSLMTSSVNQTKQTYIGLNAVTNNESFSGLIDQLSISYSVKNRTEITYIATVVCLYKFETNEINRGAGPSSIPAISQHVYRHTEDNQSSLLFNMSDSYFQSSGFTLLLSKQQDFSIGFWLRLSIAGAYESNSAIAILQLTSLINGLTSGSYSCLISAHIYPDDGTIAFFFPNFFEIIRLNNSNVKNNTWTHIGISYKSLNKYLFYENGKLIHTEQNDHFANVIADNARLSFTIGSAYLNDSLTPKPNNFEQMKCFARIPIFNYQKMYGEIDDVTVYSKTLTDLEFLKLAQTKNITISI